MGVKMGNKKRIDVLKDALKQSHGRRYILTGDNFVVFADHIDKMPMHLKYCAYTIYDLCDGKYIKNRYGPIDKKLDF